jgi:CheY-like chemotaxis protein
MPRRCQVIGTTQVLRSFNPAFNQDKDERHMTIQPPRKQCILCVDDDRVGLAVRAVLLEQEGYVVTAVGCPLSALQYDYSPFQLALLDFEMPGINGFQLLLRMRAAHATFPIVLLSGTMENVPEHIRVAFTQCLEKGVHVQRLLDTIYSYLNAPPDPPECRSYIQSEARYGRHGI